MLNHRSRPVKIDVLSTFMEELLAAVGFDPATAETVANIHLESDLRGVHVQGFNHLINSHLQYYLEGKADPHGKPEIVREGPSFALINGNSGPGPIAALFACDVAVEKAKAAGSAIIGINNSHDLFHAGLYAERVARHDLIAMLFSDDVVPVVHPLGGTEPIIGSNPLAWAAPTGGDPYLIDFTPCATLPTYVRYSRRYGGEMDSSLVADADGNPTTDPHQVSIGLGHAEHTGAINPGGNKGYGMLLMIDFLSGAFVGADMGMDHVTKKGAQKGHLLIALDPAMFGSTEAFKTAVDARLQAIKSSKKAPGIDEIRVAGEGSFARRRQAIAAGQVMIDTFCWEDALALASDLGVEVPAGV